MPATLARQQLQQRETLRGPCSWMAREQDPHINKSLYMNLTITMEILPVMEVLNA